MRVEMRVVFNKLPAVPGAVNKGVGAAFQALGPQLLSSMQGRTPVDTGELRASETATATAKSLTLRAGTDHAVYVEFGTRKMAAQPYMRPTIEAAGGQVVSVVTSEVGSALGGL